MAPDVLGVSDIYLVASLDVLQLQLAKPLVLLPQPFLELEVLILLGRELLALHQHLHNAVDHG